MEENMENISKLTQNTEEKLLKGDIVDKGTQENKDIVHGYEPYINKHAMRGLDSNNGINQG